MRNLSLLLLPLAFAVAACEDEPSTTLGDDGSADDGSDGNDDGSSDGGGPDAGGEGPGIDPALAAREIDYNEALRTASLKLVRRLPTLDQIKRVAAANDKKEAYTEELDAMLASPAFNARMLKFWRDTMRMGGEGLDTAPALAAKLMAEGRPFTDLFTAETGNCPSYDAEAGAFVEGDCQSGAPVQAGVLTDPAVMRQFYGNMAFRRLRWIQETFYCQRMPAEIAETVIQKDGKDYTSSYPFDSISGSPINFLDTESVVCANCHEMMNHAAPLFGNFDADGMWQAGIAVQTPIAPEPVTTEMSHWLAEGQTTSWRFGTPVNDLAELGQVIAEDPAVTECMVARVWNFALSKEDIVTDLATLPYGVIEKHVVEYETNGRDLKAVLRDIFLSEDFVSF